MAWIGLGGIIVQRLQEQMSQAAERQKAQRELDERLKKEDEGIQRSINEDVTKKEPA